jgi:hypothetical protein
VHDAAAVCRKAPRIFTRVAVIAPRLSLRPDSVMVPPRACAAPPIAGTWIEKIPRFSTLSVSLPNDCGSRKPSGALLALRCSEGTLHSLATINTREDCNHEFHKTLAAQAEIHADRGARKRVNLGCRLLTTAHSRSIVQDTRGGNRLCGRARQRRRSQPHARQGAPRIATTVVP